MSYCTVEEVRGMIKSDALNMIIGDEYIEDEALREQEIIPIIEEAIGDADGEIDGYLIKRYPVPLSPTPKVINKFSKDIAVYNLFSRAGIDEGEKEKNYLNRYKAAVRFLENVAKGIIDIGITDSTQKANTGFSMTSNTRLFSRNSMKGM
jgi:phage gp36-like protein